MSVLQDIYDSEINVSISTFWDAGYDVKLGDKVNGFRAETSLRRWGEVETWLSEQVIKLYPNSLFALMYRDGLSRYRGEIICGKTFGRLGE